MADAHLRYDDPWSIVVITITLVLFVIALAIKGIVHDMLLEAGIFMVSVKLILLNHRNIATARNTDIHLQQMQSLLQEIKQNTCRSAPSK